MKKLFFLLAFCQSVFAASFSVDASGCDVHFSPKGGATEAVVQIVDGTKSSVHVLAYGFTSQPITDALIRAHARGAEVLVVLDRSNKTAPSSKMPDLIKAGIPVWIDATHAIAHNKVMIVDGALIENGSFNYTNSAENSNGENALVCHSTQGAAIYEADFQRHKSHSVKQ